tara:strand:+ start:1147 stop:2001 length:855 start_codon:yes stop_codon:yes gene_type:complete
MYMQDVLAKLKDIAEKSDNRDINDAIKSAEMTQTVVAEKQEPTVDEVHEVIAEEEVVNEIPTSNEISDLLRLSGQSGVLGINQPSVIIKEDEVGEGIKVVAKDPNAELDIGAEKKAGPMKTDVDGYKPITGKEKSSNGYKALTDDVDLEETIEVPITELADLLRLAGYSEVTEEEFEPVNAPKEVYADAEEQLIAQSGGLNGPKTHYPAAAGGDNPMAVQPLDVTSESVYQKYIEFVSEENKSKATEAAKPDYIDLDGDGDKKESMKKAADDKAADDKNKKKSK